MISMRLVSIDSMQGRKKITQPQILMIVSSFLRNSLLFADKIQMTWLVVWGIRVIYINKVNIYIYIYIRFTIKTIYGNDQIKEKTFNV